MQTNPDKLLSLKPGLEKQANFNPGGSDTDLKEAVFTIKPTVDMYRFVVLEHNVQNSTGSWDSGS